MNRRILFLVDHKHRDLPSLTLIACHLKNLGFEPHLIALGDELDVIARVDPSIIVLPKPIYDYERLIRWRFDGRRLVIIETEGNPQDIEFEMRIRVPPDLHLFWNETIASRYRDRLQAAGTVVCVLGFPRSDFLHPRMSEVFPSRHELLERYGLNRGQRTLTIATSGQDSHFSERRVRDKRKRRNRSLARTAEYLEIVANMRELRDKTTAWVGKLVRRYPTLNVAIKPHPHENAVFWSDFVDSLKSPNVALVVGEPINHLLQVSDFHLAFNVCTTTVEALLKGLPTAEIQTKRSSALYGERHLSLPTYYVMELEHLTTALDAELASTPARKHQQPESRARLDAYVAEFLHAYDGRRCEAYAEAIAEWARADGGASSRWKYALRHPAQAAFFLALRARAAARRVLHAGRGDRTALIVAAVNAPSTSGARPVREIKGALVDAEFGVYDNRVRPGDEQRWVGRFRDAGVLQMEAQLIP